MQKRFEAPAVKVPVGALGRRDAASYIGVSTRQLDNYARAGQLQQVKLGSKTAFRVIDLDRFLASRLQQMESAK